MLDSILNMVFSHCGIVTGSYVRDILVLGKEFTYDRDIDVLIPYSSIEKLAKELEGEFSAITIVYDNDEDEEIAHYNFIIRDDNHEGEIAHHNFIIDVFACGNDYCYLSPADFDVNTLTWNGSEYGTWFRFSLADAEYYGDSFDTQNIIDRCLRKEAVFLIREWVDDNGLLRKSKLLSQGWKVL